MKRWFPHPMHSALIAATWLLLQQSVAVPNLLFAALLAWGLPRLVEGFTGTPAPPKAWRTGARLAVVVLHDIVVANVAVARLVLSPWARPEPIWVPLDLEIRDPRAVTLLATIITTTPGTVSCTVDESAHRILVHALDGSAGVAAIADEIRTRYERPLKEIFE